MVYTAKAAEAECRPQAHQPHLSHQPHQPHHRHQAEEVLAFVRRTFFVLPRRAVVLADAIGELVRGTPSSEAHFLALAVPILEHAVRCVFAAVNQRPG